MNASTSLLLYTIQTPIKMADKPWITVSWVSDGCSIQANNWTCRCQGKYDRVKRDKCPFKLRGFIFQVSFQLNSIPPSLGESPSSIWYQSPNRIFTSNSLVKMSVFLSSIQVINGSEKIFYYVLNFDIYNGKSSTPPPVIEPISARFRPGFLFTQNLKIKD